MIETGFIILIHQLIFQGMFTAKNIYLRRNTRKQIHGKNKEAVNFIFFSALFIGVAFASAFLEQPLGKVQLLSSFFSMTLGILLLSLNLIISIASLISLRDSWRVGILEDQKTELIVTGIYRFTRNPYFLSYLLMFAAYTILLQNLVLLGLSIAGFFLIHKMIRKEEEYLYSVHGDAYIRYKRDAPRYIII